MALEEDGNLVPKDTIASVPLAPLFETNVSYMRMQTDLSEEQTSLKNLAKPD